MPRYFIEKKPEKNHSSFNSVKNELQNFLNIPVADARLFTGVDSDCDYDDLTLLYEPVTENIYDKLPHNPSDFVLGVMLTPAQFNWRADEISRRVGASVKLFDVYVISGDLSETDKETIKNYLINPVDSRMINVLTPLPGDCFQTPELRSFDGFIGKPMAELEALYNQLGLAMPLDDFMFIHAYFKEDENRDPTETEIFLFDIYWSDHCRHTTFNTHIDNVSFEDGHYSDLFKETYELYLRKRKQIGNSNHITLMDLATISAKVLKAEGKLENIDESDEVNACSVNINVQTDTGAQEWLLMFKNETHNHPTEIEPFGGAATCLGGAIRDPLAGRAYVYQAMRVTGSADPRKPYAATLQGKLPQRQITRTAASGYSHYGNRIGCAAGHISELYHEGYEAKRMELGAVVGAVKKDHVKRMTPVSGDVVLLIGGRTGRDGIGAATGSSQVQTTDALASLGAEVQKGNPAAERAIVRLFMRTEAALMIKRCNDFGAGGVAVAVGEIADGLEIDLNKIPVKYDGLTATEIVLAESQERMAVVVSRDNMDEFLALAREEDVEAVKIADITDSNRLVMLYNGEVIVNISRSFLNTSGMRKNTSVFVSAPDKREIPNVSDADYLLPVLSDLNVASQKGLIEMFDATAGGLSVLAPLGGLSALSPAQAMAAKIPAAGSKTASVMAYGFDPYVSELCPFHGAVAAITDSIAKIVAAGAELSNIYLSFQEYFERLNTAKQWGKPFAALLGAFYAQMKLGFASIGGKDSMSGTYGEISVPPTLVSFAVSTAPADNIISQEFKSVGSHISLLYTPRDKNELPDLEIFLKNIKLLEKLIKEKKILSAYAIGVGGIAAAVAKMSFGNFIGAHIEVSDLYQKNYGSFVLETADTINAPNITRLGKTTGDYALTINAKRTELSVALAAWLSALENVFPTGYFEHPQEFDYTLPVSKSPKQTLSMGIPRPNVFLPVFPGTNGEIELANSFLKAGGNPRCAPVFDNKKAAAKIKDSQILSIPAGGDYIFIANFLSDPYIKDAISYLIEKNGLILGINEGFAALLRAGLITCKAALTDNGIGRFVSAFARVKILNDKSPWLYNAAPGDVYVLPIASYIGRFTASEETICDLSSNGQITMQYVDLQNTANADIRYNPFGSDYAVCALSSECGKILGSNARFERSGINIHKNIPDTKDLQLFEAGIKWFS